MLEITNFDAEPMVAEERPIIPAIQVIETTDTYGKFHIEPLERGYGLTLGNPMRRILLSSIEGASVTWVKIEGALHEYSSVPHVKEEVMELLYNIRQVRIRSVTGRPGKMRLEVTGQGLVCAGDIAASSDFEIVNPQQHIATMDAPDGGLEMELNVEPGKGYVPAVQGDGLPRGVLPLDAIYNPVRKVNYAVEKTRVGQITDYERLSLEVWTDGTITPSEALKAASEILVNHFFLFNGLDKDGEVASEGTRPSRLIPPDVYQTPIEKLDLSPRTLNSLKRAQLRKVGEILEMTNEELFKIRNFGVKSLSELYEKLDSLGFSRDEPMPNGDEPSGESSESVASEGEKMSDEA